MLLFNQSNYPDFQLNLISGNTSWCPLLMLDGAFPQWHDIKRQVNHFACLDIGVVQSAFELERKTNYRHPVTKCGVVNKSITNKIYPKILCAAMCENGHVPQRRLKLACTSAQSDQSLHCLHEDNLHYLSEMRSVEILIRLREYSMGAHDKKDVFRRCGSY